MRSIRHLAAVLLLPAFLSALSALLAQPPSDSTTTSAPSAVDAPKTTTRTAIFKSHAYSGWQNCHICHRLGDRGQPDDNQKLEILVAMNESTIWSKDDKHALAARVLVPDEATQNLAFRMRQVYGQQAWEQVQSQCRACHVAGERTNDQVLGVTCEACHGPAKDYVQPHWEDRTTWRYLGPTEKENAGLVNLRDPVTKTETCLSCHLGSLAEGKLVTHDMYAAGHPPLPGFDTATFTLAMPVHWSPLHEKPDARYKQIHGADHNFAPQTREVLLAGLTSLACYLELLADYSEEPAADSPWPELALYDCFACHHDLQSRSWRQARGYGGNKPGRPPLRSWPKPLALLALQQIDAPAELHDKLAAVARSLDEQPFGDRKALGGSARAAAVEIRTAIASLRASLAHESGESLDAARKRDLALVRELLGHICELAATEHRDYDAARQLVWAFDRAYEDLVKLNREAVQNTTIEKLIEQLKSPELKFDLIRGQHQIGEPATLAALLEARAKYRPERFSTTFSELSKLLKPLSP
jgi:hypothetical protein